MSPDDFAVLDLLRCELKLRARQPTSLPFFLGSTLRGAFGHALKEAVCVMDHRQCERCMLADRCIYPYLFETPVPPDVPQLRGQKQAPHPFILTPPMLLGDSLGAPLGALGAHASCVQRIPPSATTSQEQTAVRGTYPSSETASRAVPGVTHPRVSTQALSDGKQVRLVHPVPLAEANGRRHLARGDELTFGLVLMGRAIDYLPYVVFAVSEMARRGLGADRARFELAEVAVVAPDDRRQSIYSRETRRITAPSSAVQSLSNLIRLRLDELGVKSSAAVESLTVRFLTPARIRVEGDLQVGMSFQLLVRNLLRRVSMLAAVHGSGRLELDYRGLIDRAAEVRTRPSSLRWFDWERYSNRQQTKMALGGFMGEVEYAGEIIQEFLPLMAAGETLHVGGSTTFGLGEYEVLPLFNKPPNT